MGTQLDLDDVAATSDLAKKQLEDLRAENKLMREALEEISQNHYGLEIGDDDETAIKYWSSRALIMKNKALVAIGKE
jgi:hypothetical protein